MNYEQKTFERVIKARRKREGKKEFLRNQALHELRSGVRNPYKETQRTIKVSFWRKIINFFKGLWKK